MKKFKPTGALKTRGGCVEKQWEIYRLNNTIMQAKLWACYFSGEDRGMRQLKEGTLK